MNPLDLLARACRFGLEYATEAKRTNAPSYAAKQAARQELAVLKHALSGLKAPIVHPAPDQTQETLPEGLPQ